MRTETVQKKQPTAPPSPKAPKTSPTFDLPAHFTAPIPPGWHKIDATTWSIPDAYFHDCEGVGPGAVIADGVPTKVWDYSGEWVPVPQEWSFLGVSSLLSAAKVMAKAKNTWKASLEGAPTATPLTNKPTIAPTLTPQDFEYAIKVAKDDGVAPGSKFFASGIEWYVGMYANHIIVPVKTGAFLGHSVDDVEAMAKQANTLYGSVGPAKGPKVLTVELIKSAMEYVAKEQITPGATFAYDGTVWWFMGTPKFPSAGGHFGVMPNHLDDFNILYHPAKALADQAWGLYGSLMEKPKKALTDEWLWPAFEYAEAQNIPPDGNFTYDGVSFGMMDYSLGGGVVADLSPVPETFTWLPGFSNLYAANQAVWKSYQAWKASKHPSTLHLTMGAFKQAILNAYHNGAAKGDVFMVGGHAWWWDPQNDVIIPNEPFAWNITVEDQLTWGKNAMLQWGSVLHPSQPIADALTKISDHGMLWKYETHTEANLFAMFEAWTKHMADSGETTFMFKGHKVFATNIYNGDTMPVYDQKASYPDGYTWNNANIVVWPIFQKWKASKVWEMPKPIEWIASVPKNQITSNTIDSTPAAKNFPKWGPSTAKFEHALQEALKTRLGPYATDSMVEAVTQDMLPVLRSYWEEVNDALVALKMTAAEQGTPVPSMMPGWKPPFGTDKIVPDTAVPKQAPTLGATKMDSATAIWKSNLSPYLKKQYTLKIEFGIACGALKEGTSLDTPYIDLWIMEVKKHSKKGTAAVGDAVAYNLATEAWNADLQGVKA